MTSSSETKRAPLAMRSAAGLALFTSTAALAAFQLWPEYRVLATVAAAGALILAGLAREAAAAQLALLIALLLAWNGFARPVQWPLPTLVPIIAWAAIVLAASPLRRSVDWLRLGRADAFSGALAIALAGLSSIILLAWARIAHPDLSDIVAQLPKWPPPLLLLAGLAFAVGNALMEELIWRGAMQSALEKVLAAPWLALALQAASFGVAHANGFPRGALGMALAGGWGLVIGYLRIRTGGLLVPVLAHIAADATVFAILTLVLL